MISVFSAVLNTIKKSSTPRLNSGTPSFRGIGHFVLVHQVSHKLQGFYVLRDVERPLPVPLPVSPVTPNEVREVSLRFKLGHREAEPRDPSLVLYGLGGLNELIPICWWLFDTHPVEDLLVVVQVADAGYERDAVQGTLYAACLIEILEVLPL